MCYWMEKLSMLEGASLVNMSQEKELVEILGFLPFSFKIGESYFIKKNQFSATLVANENSQVLVFNYWESLSYLKDELIPQLKQRLNHTYGNIFTFFCEGDFENEPSFTMLLKQEEC